MNMTRDIAAERAVGYVAAEPSLPRLDPRHVIHGLMHAVAQCIARRFTLDPEAMLLVERDGRAVVGEHGQLETRDVQPVFREIDRSREQPAADAAPVARRSGIK